MMRQTGLFVTCLVLLVTAPLLAQERSAFVARGDLRIDFEPLRNPQFVPAAKADFLKDTDVVLGVSESGVSKAYRTDILAWHHITHDQLGKLPVLVTW
jgi:hypothetical protein